jgi:tetratricopeptide (TPR) repeat protein/tRNA A-37 threonylcarbamoyl transferase component Bud32
MTPERWAEVGQLLLAARELSREERDAFVEEECRGDSNLRSELESLLASVDPAESFLEQSAAGHSRQAAAGSRLRVGPYELLEEVGRGGMGVVFKAVRRDQGFERPVAVKLVKRGMDTDFILRRFESERRILAGLDHPNIARVLDGGSTEDGLPYFVMELIDGRHLLQYCDEEGLDTAARVTLFRQVCSAVTYAHQRLVIHRDIKPSNVLVTSEGVPKLLDFGLAKALTHEAGETVERTRTALRVLTPEYASPEQVRGEEITTASDVYSLGVVLYELLTGVRPYKLESRNSEEISSAVLNQQPERPSANTRLPRDLDNIVLMALRKEPDRRYASAEQFSEDIHRHLEGLPVLASPDSFGYRAGKFVRRHKLGVAASALVAASLVVGFGIVLWQAGVAHRERALADRRFEQVRKVANSFLFDVHDAVAKLPGSTPARALLIKKALEYLDSLSREAGGDRGLKAELAEAYSRVAAIQSSLVRANLGEGARAGQSYRKALALREELAAGPFSTPEDRASLARFQLFYCTFLVKSGNTTRALDLARRAVAIDRALLSDAPGNGNRRGEVGVALSREGMVLGRDGRLQEAREVLEQAVGHLEAAGPEQFKAALATAYADLGIVFDKMENPRESLRSHGAARRVNESLLESDPSNVTLRGRLSMNLVNMARALVRLRDGRTGMETQQKALELGQALAAADPQNMYLKSNLGMIHRVMGQNLLELETPGEALGHLDAASAIFQSIAAVDPSDARARSELAEIYLVAGDAHAQLASLARRGSSGAREEGERACRFYRRSLDFWNAMRAQGRLLKIEEAGLRESALKAASCGSD